MKIEKFTIIDRQYLTGVLATEDGKIDIEAERLPGDLHIDRAIWHETGEDASDIVASNLAQVRAEIAAALAKALV